ELMRPRVPLNAALQRQYSRFEVAGADISRTDRPDPVDREGFPLASSPQSTDIGWPHPKRMLRSVLGCSAPARDGIRRAIQRLRSRPAKLPDVQPPICCIRESRFPTPQWSVIFPF